MHWKSRMKGLFIAGLGGVCVRCPEFVSLFLYECVYVCVCWRQVNSSLIQSSQGCVCCTDDPLGFSGASLRGDSSPRVHQGMKCLLCSPWAPESALFPSLPYVFTRDRLSFLHLLPQLPPLFTLSLHPIDTFKTHTHTKSPTPPHSKWLYPEDAL